MNDLKEMNKIDKKIEREIKKLKRHETYHEKILRLNSEYDNLIFSLSENGNSTLEELRRMTLMGRIKYQNYLVNRMNKQSRGGNKS